LHAVMLKATNPNIMKLFGLILSFVLTQTCVAQFPLTKLDRNSIPRGIQYNGKIVRAVRWTDSTGTNIVILTATGEIRSKNSADEDYSDGALYAYHFIVSGDSLRQTWKVYDYVKECPVDMFLYFVEKSFIVTDLDKDGLRHHSVSVSHLRQY
jgi:hypothetical protein